MGRRLVPISSILALLAVLLVPSAAGAADGPSIRHIRPAPGEVVVGDVTIVAVVRSPAGVSDVTLEVDGKARSFNLDESTGVLKSGLDLGPGHHIANLEMRDHDGHVARRIWRFGVSELTVGRIAGDDRISTAVAISQADFRDARSANAVVLAKAGDYPDALAAAPLATFVDGPLLLTGSDDLSPATASELRRVLPKGATVYLLGGGSALTSGVASEVRSLGFETHRIAGDSRAETAAAIAAELPARQRAIVTTGANFADALAAAAPAARDGLPILLTDTDDLPTVTKKAIRARDVREVIVVGGEVAVEDVVVEQIEDLGVKVRRLAGADRYATAAEVRDHFGGPTKRTVVASGDGFADALAGGPYAGRNGFALELSRRSGLAPQQALAIASHGPTRVDLLGGEAALTDRVVGDLHRATLGDRDMPIETEIIPAHGSVANSLSTIEVGFDQDLDLSDSWIHVTIDGAEILGRTLQADFSDRIVFQTFELPFAPQAGVDYPVEVFVLANNGESWRHVQFGFTYRKLDLGRGDTGPSVTAIQNRLTELGYWIGKADGTFGYQTAQAIMAFQKYEGLPRTGEADATTRARLESAARPVPRANNRSGRWVEIDKTRQVMLFILNGRVEWAMNTSTGTETYYTRPDGSRGFAHTPEGWFTFNRQIDGLREAELGRLWRPKYFTSAGHAIHGSSSIPAHPASHGCARLSNQGIDFVWAAGLAPLGTPLWVYV